MLYTRSIALTASGLIRARWLDGDKWSALNEAYFMVNAVAADNTNLVFSELNLRTNEYLKPTNTSDNIVNMKVL